MYKVSLAIHCASSKKKTRLFQQKEQAESSVTSWWGPALTVCEAMCTALWHRDREQPDVRLALRGKAFTQEVRMTSVVGKASGWVAAGHGLSQLHQKNASYPITHTASLVYKTTHLEDTRAQLTWLLWHIFLLHAVTHWNFFYKLTATKWWLSDGLAF